MAQAVAHSERMFRSHPGGVPSHRRRKKPRTSSAGSTPTAWLSSSSVQVGFAVATLDLTDEGPVELLAAGAGIVPALGLQGQRREAAHLAMGFSPSANCVAAVLPAHRVRTQSRLYAGRTNWAALDEGDFLGIVDERELTKRRCSASTAGVDGPDHSEAA